MYDENGYQIRNDDAGNYTVSGNGESFTFSQSDFRVRSLRSSMVLRWEWRPGSAFFLVWQQDRSGSGNAMSRRTDYRDLIESFQDVGNNIIAVKFSYWLPMGR